jgi:hypothetical protein
MAGQGLNWKKIDQLKGTDKEIERSLQRSSISTQDTDEDNKTPPLG